jgi:transcriptional regulator with XRE-family HTH domain
MSLVGDRIRSARERAGLTQDELAARCRVGRTVVAQWEAGTAAPDPQALAALARALQADLAWFRGTVATTAEPPGFATDAPLRPAVETRHSGPRPELPARPPVELPAAIAVASRELSEKKAKPAKKTADGRRQVAPAASPTATQPVRPSPTETAPAPPAVSTPPAAPAAAAPPPPNAGRMAPAGLKPETATNTRTHEGFVPEAQSLRSPSRPAASPNPGPGSAAPRTASAATPKKQPQSFLIAELLCLLIFAVSAGVPAIRVIERDGFTLYTLLPLTTAFCFAAAAAYIIWQLPGRVRSAWRRRSGSGD